MEDWRGETVLVLRPHADLICVACPPGAASLLRACLEHKLLGEAAQAATATDPDFDFGRTLVELTEYRRDYRFKSMMNDQYFNGRAK